MERHNEAVAVIAAQVRIFYATKEPFRISHGSTNTTRPLRHKQIVDTGPLCNVLHLDNQKKTILVEPNVSMDRLVEATIPHGLIPPVVPEFPGITVGGSYAGTAGESSSFKHGFFDRTINKVEMVLADGTIVEASEKEREDLFRGSAGAVGSLGVTTAVELKLMRAKKWVETTYHPIRSVSEAVRKVKEVTTSEAGNDFVDGILYSKTEGVIVTGRMIDAIADDMAVQRFSGAWDPWFYLHARQQIATGEPVKEAIPLAEYLFRYDRGGFWVGASAFKWFKAPFNRFSRWLLDDLLHTRMLYKALHASGQSRRYVVQDLALPFDAAEKFVDFTADNFKIWPLWLCPLKQSPYPTMHPHYLEDEPTGSKDQPMMLNIGLWGESTDNYDTFVALNRRLEQVLRELRGMKWFYAHTYYSKDEFWRQFDRKWYKALRVKYNAMSLPSVYDKVKVDVDAEKHAIQTSWRKWLLEIWLVRAFWGIYKSIRSRTYMLARQAKWKTMEIGAAEDTEKMVG